MAERAFSRHCCRVAFCVTLLFFAAGSVRLQAQIQYPGGTQYLSGQDVSPMFDGWEGNADGTYSFYIGYLNRNSQEELDVPIGPDNKFDLGDGDQGQPTHFYPGRRW